MTTTYGYVRVSTARQRDEGYSLPAQRRSISRYARFNGLGRVKYYSDGGVSAKTLDRPELQKLLKIANSGDHIICHDLSRLTRSTKDCLGLLDLFTEQHINLHSVKEKLDTSSAIGRFTVTILAAVVQLEREASAERTKEGMAEARRRGVRLGAPPCPKKLITVVHRLRYKKDPPWTFQKIADNLNKRGIKTARGKLWTLCTVAHLCRFHPDYIPGAKYGKYLER